MIGCPNRAITYPPREEIKEKTYIK